MRNLFLILAVVLVGCSKPSSVAPVAPTSVQLTENLIVANSWIQLGVWPTTVITFYKGGVYKPCNTGEGYSLWSGKLNLYGPKYSVNFWNCILKQDTIFCSKDSASQISNLPRYIKAN
jgi:hypothetical protein